MRRSRDRIHVSARVSEWAGRQPDGCEHCHGPRPRPYHILPPALFADPLMAHFRENLVALCADCRDHTENQARAFLAVASLRTLPFVRRLPAGLLDQLASDGRIERLPETVDFSLLGSLAGSLRSRLVGVE
jgi:hypothetical protein